MLYKRLSDEVFILSLVGMWIGYGFDIVKDFRIGFSLFLVRFDCFSL